MGISRSVEPYMVHRNLLRGPPIGVPTFYTLVHMCSARLSKNMGMLDREKKRADR